MMNSPVTLLISAHTSRPSGRLVGGEGDETEDDATAGEGTVGEETEGEGTVGEETEGEETVGAGTVVEGTVGEETVGAEIVDAGNAEGESAGEGVVDAGIVQQARGAPGVLVQSLVQLDRRPQHVQLRSTRVQAENLARNVMRYLKQDSATPSTVLSTAYGRAIGKIKQAALHLAVPAKRNRNKQRASTSNTVVFAIKLKSKG